jgi:hypothetical protein
MKIMSISCENTEMYARKNSLGGLSEVKHTVHARRAYLMEAAYAASTNPMIIILGIHFCIAQLCT